MLDRLDQMIDLVTREALAMVADAAAKEALSAALSQEKTRPVISCLSFVKKRESSK